LSQNQIIDLGVTRTILMILRDIRLKKFNHYVIGILESNLHVFLNCYPNFSMNIVRNEKKLVM